MKILSILGVLLLAATVAQAATVYGNIWSITGTNSTGQILIHPTRPQVIGTNLVDAIDLGINTTNGYFAVNLLQNDYELRFSSRARDNVTISVPPGDGSYNFLDLITNRIVYVYVNPVLKGILPGTNVVFATNTPVSGPDQTITISLTDNMLTLLVSNLVAQTWSADVAMIGSTNQWKLLSVTEGATTNLTFGVNGKTYTVQGW